ncbi:MAG: hypothetical protein ACM3IJ_02200 [Candidatus Levyibacteriota bacterium]
MLEAWNARRARERMIRTTAEADFRRKARRVLVTGLTAEQLEETTGRKYIVPKTSEDKPKETKGKFVRDISPERRDIVKDAVLVNADAIVNHEYFYDRDKGWLEKGNFAYLVQEQTSTPSES